VLGVQDLGPHENFFELGGHSLLATKVISQLRACFGIEIPLRAVFDNPTISELSGFIAGFSEVSRTIWQRRTTQFLSTYGSGWQFEL
jgi:hypothetical protein